MRLPVLLACLAVLLALPAPAQAARSAEDKRIERMVRDAQRAYDSGDCRGAADLLLKAYEIKAVPKLLFNVARAFEKCGDEAQTLRYYERYVDVGNDAALVRRASKALDRLRARRDARLAEEKRLQDEQARKAERARREAAEARAAAARAEADARAREAEALRQAPAAATASTPAAVSRGPSPFAFGLAGLAVAGLGTGIAFGVLADGAKGDFEAATDLEVKSSYRGRAKQRALIADVSFGVAAAAAVGATVLFVLTTDLAGSSSAPMALSAGPGGVRVSGTCGP